ncbi:hypothetical protein [Fervidicoccus fontis]|uniref:MarR family transcriptional regulator n=1 Tax=Fervidicoccus fontis (strain DSM 19380 / JCM 18336 / VKM B-2539 / Kam940) TaxID=1163730 RepID=H9ZZP6_FERFK|nr:hypothetical protein [Fervidicoccus fontis]AFH42203.1 hypothetical protein FFONT_0212 [Fervidicoccus fontis Kam940]
MTNLGLIKLLLLTGLPLSACVLFSILFYNGKPMSFKELVEKSGYTKGHVSNILKLLESFNLVERIPERKKVYFVAKKEGIYNHVVMHLKSLQENLSSIINNLDEKDRKKAQTFLSDLDLMLRRVSKNA